MEQIKIIELIKNGEEKLKTEFQKIDNLVFLNSAKVLKAFQKNEVSDTDFNGTTGYGYNDIGREKIEKIYADIFKSESALVRAQIISGTHALTISLFGLLRPGDTLLSITGKPYDTLDPVIGILENDSSLISWGINYEQIDLLKNDFNYSKIKTYLKKNKVKVISIQRSRGYSLRQTISYQKLKKVIKLIKEIDKNIIIFVDNCYCEFCEENSPIEAGASIAVGSLIKNLGGTIAPNGGYVVGQKDLIELIAERLTVPGAGSEVGPSLNINRDFLKGLSLAPSVVGSSLKSVLLASYIAEELKIKIYPKLKEEHSDIVLALEFGDKDNLIKFVQGIQKGSLIDSNVLPIPSGMPGYDDEIIMASGSFVQGSSIELSCDGPLRAPYVAYLQGGTTYEYAKLGLIKAFSNIDIN